MALGRQNFRAASLAVLAAAVSLNMAAQPAQQVASSLPSAPVPQQQQQSVPDAPTPQALPKLNTITPVGPLVVAPTTPAPTAEQQAPGTSLPGAAKPAVEDPDLGPPPDMTTPRQSSIVINSTFVQVPFTVKDSKGVQVPGLTWRDVRIFENGVRYYPKLFTTDPYPLSVALVIDQSVTFDTMNKINASLAALQGAFSKYDEVAVFTYNNGVRMQTTFTAAQSARLGVILDRSKGKGREPIQILGGPMSQTTLKNNMAVDPNTQPVGQRNGGAFEQAPKEYHTLLDAILSAAVETTKAGRDRRRIVYVISDGKEYGSKAKEKEVIKYCQTNNVQVYATLVGDSSIPGLGFLDRIHLPLTMRDDILPRVTNVTGGQTDPEFFQRGIEKSFAKITEEVRTQYTIGYYTKASPFDERFRKIEVRVMRPNLTVISKDGYYPSASDHAPQPKSAPTAVAY